MLKTLFEKIINTESSRFYAEKMFKVCTLYFEYCNLFIRKDKFSFIKSLVGHFQFMDGQRNNLVGHLILPQIFPIGQNVQCALHLVGRLLDIVRCPTIILRPGGMPKKILGITLHSVSYCCITWGLSSWIYPLIFLFYRSFSQSCISV